MKKLTSLFLLTILSILSILSACNNNESTPINEVKGIKATQISLTTASNKNLALVEETVGSLESVIDPTIAAEMSARVVQVLIRPGQRVKKGDTIALLDGSDFGLQRQEALTEVARIEALLENQNKVVERNRALVDKNFISKNALDDVTTQQAALKQQLAGAKSRIATINHNSSKNRVLAPTDGIVETQIVAAGDFVNVGDPIAQIISNKLLRAHLPFPERVAAKLQPGLTVKLTTPTSDKEVTSVIRELKPQVMANNRTIDVTADIQDEADWQPGASVNGKVLLGERVSAILVPEQSVVLRPAGEVVYEIVKDEAVQRVVKTGLQQNGMVEILEGLKGGETIAMDGAAFLTDKAKVSVLGSKS
ncbi:MAG: efflux RND transporter periplasmic adaptor subunit [Methylophilaceae bacterium]